MGLGAKPRPKRQHPLVDALRIIIGDDKHSWIAMQSGVSTSMVSAILHGHRTPSIGTFAKLAGALGYEVKLVPIDKPER